MLLKSRLWWCGALSMALLASYWILSGKESAIALSQRPAEPVEQFSKQLSPPGSFQSKNNADVLAAIAASQVVYLAETHDDIADHTAQLAIVQALSEQGDIVIGLEMFQRPFQPTLDAYLADEITEAALITQSEYETRWGFDWEFYAPILRYAKTNQIPVLALNTPTEITRKVAISGLESLKGDDLTYIPPIADINTDNREYEASIREVFSAHGGMGNSISFDNFFAAQVLWDETMAERVTQQLKAEPDHQVVVLAGDAHILYDYGIPSRVARRMPAVTQASVLLAPEQELAGATDFVWVTAD